MRFAKPVALLLPIGLVMLLPGCLPSQQAPSKADLRATDTPGRVPALVDAADEDDERTLAELVRALSDEDPAVRLFAIQALSRRTGQTLGYRYYESADHRQAAAERWHRWLDEQDGGAPSAAVDPEP